MPYSTLVGAAEVAAHVDDPEWVVVDCRFSLADTDAGRRAYEERTIRRAVYAHLDRDLSGPLVPGETGRHPLPTVDDFVATLRRWGIDDGTQVVAFDDMGGPFAARLWWMLRQLGHDAVAVLDGGIAAYEAAGGQTAAGEDPRGEGTIEARPRSELRADAAEVGAAASDPSVLLVDARAPVRYRGEEEPLDPVAGHIPGAHNLFWKENLDDGGRFLPAAALRARFSEALAGREPARAIVYCGSGVTACHDLLAMEHAGLGGARLYPGSWSEWITDPGRPRTP